MSWTTPVPVEPDTMWCVWHNMWSGSYEFICGSERAAELLNGGMTKVNGVPCMVSVAAEWPELGAVQLLVRTVVATANPQYAWELAA